MSASVYILPITAILLSAVGGHFVTQPIVCELRRRFKEWAERNNESLDERMTKSVKWLVALVGMTERAIVTGLVILAPSLVATFIVAWVLAKLAGGWGRIKEPSVQIRATHMIALIGNALSFAIAIGIGAIATAWATKV